jgi:uncharacterized protein (TIGR03118 family)
MRIPHLKRWRLRMDNEGKGSVRALATIAVTFAMLFAAVYGFAQTAGESIFKQANLVSDQSGVATTTDKNLVNAWGITHGPAGPWWVNDNGAAVTTVYDGQGRPFPLATSLVVKILTPSGGSGSAAPTGIVFNGTKDFEVETGKPAQFIFVTEDGTVAAWNSEVPSANSTEAMVKADNSASGAVYKGAAMALDQGVPKLYAANFNAATIDVFGTDFKKVDMGQNAFKDANIPAGYAPFNVMSVDGRLFVSYALQNAAKHDDVKGAGHGFVNIFTPDGRLEMRLNHGSWMNSPWGMALAPADFGTFGRRLLVGNFGSGRIASFDLQTGRFMGFILKSNGSPVTIDGLWGLGFGNGQTAGPANTLFFSAGPNGEKDGLFGTLTPSGTFAAAPGLANRTTVLPNRSTLTNRTTLRNRTTLTNRTTTLPNTSTVAPIL